MVRLINGNNIKKVTEVAYFFMHIQEFFTYIKEIDNPGVEPCVYAMWHKNQFCVYGLKNKSKVNILISNSLDGEIVSSVCERMGFQTCRGSSNRRGCVASSLKMIDKLKRGESIAIMVDGPRGPEYKVKRGAIVLARDAGVPIVPMTWYSDELTFLTLPSWDKMKTPFGPCRIINLYGKPIYVDNKTDEEVAEEVKQAIFELERIAPEKFKEAKKQKLWRVKK